MLSRFETFICDITEIDLYWHRLASNEMKPYGLKGNYAIYFTRLNQYPNGISAAELGALCGKDKADVSRDIRVLENAGLVTRSTGTSSYRAPIILTEEGKSLTKEIVKKAETAVQIIGQDLSDSDRECFYRTLDTITNNLKQLSETGL